MSPPDRIVVLDGSPNFRDLGGYPGADGRRVRWGRVYRSGSLSRLTGADLDTVSSLGIGRVTLAFFLLIGRATRLRCEADHARPGLRRSRGGSLVPGSGEGCAALCPTRRRAR